MQYTKIYHIKGMHCASCASMIEKTLKKVEGVHAVHVNYGTETAKISFDASYTNANALSSHIEPLGYSLVEPLTQEMGMSAEEHVTHHGQSLPKKNSSTSLKTSKLIELSLMKTNVISSIPLTILSIFVMGWEIFSQVGIAPAMPYMWSEFFHHVLPLMATYMLFVIGKPYLFGLYRFLRYGKANMDTLIGIGTSAAYLYSFIVTAFEQPLRPFINGDHTYYDVTIVVIAFITLGKYLEARSKLKTGDAIEKLLNLQAKVALVIRNGVEQEVAVDTLVHGDLIVVKPAGKIPVDGILTQGSSYVDEAMISGEPIPVEKNVGDHIVAGTINTSGTFTFRATKVGSETLLAHIIKMVEEAQGSKAPIQALADKISSIFVPVVLVLACVALSAWLLIGTSYIGLAQALSSGLVSFVGILVIACPCALGLATPTAIIVGVGKGAKEGILIKDAATLQKLHNVNVVVVDKTGTITKGKPEFISLENYSEMKDANLMSILATLENKSEHPIAHAIVSYAKEKELRIQQVERFEIIKGKGVKGVIAGVEYFAGNAKLVKDLKLPFNQESLEKETSEGKTPVFLATKDNVCALIMIADGVKPEAIDAVKNLHRLGITIVMLTGDNKNTAAHMGKLVGIDEVIAEVSPEDKLNKIKELQSQNNIVAMAGDGVNDAPALAQADVGIAMATGTDVAIESAGITLLHGDIGKLVKAIKLSKMTMRGIKQNLFWAFIYNMIGIPLAGGLFYPIFGWLLNPVFAGLAMAFSSVSVVSNSLRLKAKKL